MNPIKLILGALCVVAGIVVAMYVGITSKRIMPFILDVTGIALLSFGMWLLTSD